MKDVLISSVSTGGSGGEDRLTENVSLNFAEVGVRYIEQKPDGSGGRQARVHLGHPGQLARRRGHDPGRRLRAPARGSPPRRPPSETPMHPMPDTLLRDADVEGVLTALGERVRAEPADAKLRVFLFQLLCVTGEWERAVRQLKVCAELDAAALPMAQAYREAIVCERLRERVFSGEAEPLILGEPEEWLALLVHALHALAAGDAEGAAGLRAEAFERAPAAPGSLDGVAFKWIADADMRLGPVLEAIVNGRYYWLPFASIDALHVEAPADLRDVVWAAADLTLRNGGRFAALIPARYPGTAERGSDAAKLSRETVWEDLGAGTFAGLGQRVLATEDGEVALMDLREIRMTPAEIPADG